MKTAFATLSAILALALTACSQPSQPADNVAPATEQNAAAPGITVADAWAAATPGGASVAAGYMTISNNSGSADTLVSISSPRAPKVELHEMTMDGEMMQMRPVSHFTVPAHGAVPLSPGGYHLMFIDVPAPFVSGESVPVTLTFEHAGAVEVTLPVRQRAATGSGMPQEHN